MKLTFFVLIDGVVISEFSELPDHLWSRDKEAECRTKSRTVHPHIEICLGSSITPFGLLVAEALFIVALHERHI